MVKKKTFRTRLWAFTNYDLDYDYLSYLDSSSAVYIIIGLETCPTTDRLHHQGFVYYSGARNAKRIDKYWTSPSIAKELGKCFVVACNGNLDQNTDYCSKDENVTEYGTKPKQGERTDLEGYRDEILSGSLTVDEICMSNPMAYHQYGRTLNKLEDLALRKKFRKKTTEGIWYYGPTGFGKSYIPFHNWDPDTMYKYPKDNGWWDGYRGQAIVVINEFRFGTMTYDKILELTEEWPETVNRRNREPAPFLAQKLIVTSPYHPKDVFHDCDDVDSLEQLERRFKIILVQDWKKSGTEVV